MSNEKNTLPSSALSLHYLFIYLYIYIFIYLFIYLFLLIIYLFVSFLFATIQAILDRMEIILRSKSYVGIKLNTYSKLFH